MALVREFEYEPIQDDEGTKYDVGVHRLPGPTRPLQMDAGNCTVVVIFSRSRCAGGTVDPDEVVQEPLKEARKIFLNPDNPMSSRALSRLQHIGAEPISMELYQQDIRARFLELLADSGVQATQFPSLDEDEDFVKLYLPPRGAAIQQLAESLKFQMPFKKEVYSNVAEHGPFLGREPLKNADGLEVMAHAPFEISKAHLFEPFVQRDAIRLLESWFGLWVQMDEMEKQGVIKCQFPCPRASQILELHDRGLRFRNWFNPWFDNLMLPMRAYFGEEITFYFKYGAYLIWSFIPLGIAGCLFSTLREFGFIPDNKVDVVKTGVAALISLWAACISQMFARHSSRVQQLWNVKDQGQDVQPNPNWNERNTREYCTIFVNLATIVFVVVYVGAVAAVLVRQYNAQEDTFFSTISPLVLSVVIKGGAILWTYLAEQLVKLENHRTINDMEDKLACMLAAVKIFGANFPFFSQCFLTNWVEQTCGLNFAAAATAVWPDYNHTLADRHTREVLHTFAFVRRIRGRRHVCFKGCYPANWAEAEAYTPTNCDINVRVNLVTYFATQIGIELALLALPLLITCWEIRKDYRHAQVRHLDDSSDDTQEPYSFLQWEAKKFKYEFNSWGGDRINDFLDVAISYSVVACWGAICPLLGFLAVIALTFSLRFRLYRMLYVTRRPIPRASAGLGVWRMIFNSINVFAVGANVGLFTVFFYPMSKYDFGTQLIAFIIAEHLVLLLQATVHLLIPENPADVVSIAYFNSHVKNCHQLKEVSANARTSLTHIELPLTPEGFSSCSDDNECTSGWC